VSNQPIENLRSSPPYASPYTHAQLTLQGAALRDALAKEVFPIKAGIPQFLHFEPAEDEQTRASLDELNRLARANGWENALRHIYRNDPELIRYVTETSRSSFIDLLPLNAAWDVLEIGPGLGQFTVVLARRARNVYALEVVPGQAEFTAERCRQEGIHNIHIAAGGDDCRLPYIARSFDLVVVNLVFEWCASRCHDEDISSVQQRFLQEVSRVLKPGGTLYLATKNRFALRFLVGKRDEHCYGLRFGSALPRPLARFLVRRKGHARPFGMLYSYNALKRMLAQVGFGEIRSYWAVPEMRYPAQYVPTDAASVRKARNQTNFPQGEMRSTRALMQLIPSPFVKHFTPGLAFLATKEDR